MSLGRSMEYDEATRLYRGALTPDPLFRIAPPLPSAALSHCVDETWYLRDAEGRLIARVSRLGVSLPGLSAYCRS
jgi:hypothetical protein